ncbi:hypothetical protein BGZ83_006466 [Gryganskiella cystojenkinii]|nr:hypothetical protein BGZ83_006466 [Gryganskiella cystojenkinii]
MQQNLDQDQAKDMEKGNKIVSTPKTNTSFTISSPPHPPTVNIKQEHQDSASSSSYAGQAQAQSPYPSYSDHQQQQQQPLDSTDQQSKYNLNKHLLAMNMQSSQQHSAQHSTPASAFSTAPSSPTLNHLQYNPNNSHHTNNNNNNNNNSNSNHTGASANASGTTTPYGAYPSYHGQSQHHPLHPYHYQHHQQQNPDLANNYYYSHSNGNSNSAGGNNPASSTAPSPMRQQQTYSSLAPPLTDSQYAQMLGPFGSTQSTPYHSSQSTPYSSIPPSPTQSHAQPFGGDQPQKSKRRQVKNACVNCQKACKKCDEGRPCSRCIKYGLSDTCVDSTRKVRKKGINRGPYKRRPTQTGSGAGSASATPSASTTPGYLSTPASALASPTQAHAIPFGSTTGNGALDMGYDYGNNSNNSSSPSAVAASSSSSAPSFHPQYPHQSQPLYQQYQEPYQHAYQQYAHPQDAYAGQQGIYGSAYGISTVGHYTDSRDTSGGGSAGHEDSMP